MTARIRSFGKGSSVNGLPGNGFVLTEVLVAFVIVAFSLMIVFQIIGRNARAQSLVGDYEQALNLAEQMLGREPEWGSSSGVHGDYGWQMSVEPVELNVDSGKFAGGSQNGPSTQLASVIVTIHWDNGERELALQTRRILPDEHFAP